MKDSDLTGKRVILEDASNIGVVTDVYVDTLDWRITKFDVRLEKRYVDRLGLEKPLLKKALAPIRIHLLKSVGDVVHIKGGIDDLARSFKKVLPAAERAKEQKAAAPKTPAAKPSGREQPPPPKVKDKPRSL